MAFDLEGFDRSAALPPELKVSHIREAVEHVEERATELLDIYFEQANVFSAIVGILGTQALHSLNPPPDHALESKASTRPWALQSHYNHAGWYVVWRYAVDQTRRLKKGKMVAIWRVDIPFLGEEDWKYEGSKAAEGRGGRTHTFGVKNPAKRFKDSIIYQSPRIKISQGGPVLSSIDD